MMKKILLIELLNISIFRKKFIYVFLNNKIISCDTILPIMLEVKNKNKIYTRPKKMIISAMFVHAICNNLDVLMQQ